MAVGHVDYFFMLNTEALVYSHQAATCKFERRRKDAEQHVFVLVERWHMGTDEQQASYL